MSQQSGKIEHHSTDLAAGYSYQHSSDAKRRRAELATDKLHSPELSIASSILPWPLDDNRSMYLGYRCSGFSIREALKLIGVVKSALSYWRLNPVFNDLEARVPEFRKQLSNDFAGIEFVRNFRLVLEKDYRVLSASLQRGVALGEQEQAYLLKMRANYTPQQLQIMEALLKASGSSEFDWTKLVTDPTFIQMTRETRKETVTVRGEDISGS